MTTARRPAKRTSEPHTLTLTAAAWESLTRAFGAGQISKGIEAWALRLAKRPREK